MTRLSDVAAATAVVLVLLATAALSAWSPSDPEPSGLPVYRTADLTPEWPAADDRGRDHRVGAFLLTDQEGLPVTQADLDGRVTVVSFFFARCTTLCPSLRSNLAAVQAAFAGDDRVQMFSHTVQPEADSAAALRAYGAVNDVRHPQWRLLTGSREAVYDLARTAYFADVAEEGFLHTETVLLLDGARRIRGVYNGTLALEVDQLIEDARALRAEAS